MPADDQPPTIDTIRQRLRELPNAANPRQSTQGKIRALLPEIDAAIENGIPRTTIIETLAEMGIAMSLPVFSTALHRARVAAKKKGGRKEERSAATKSTAPSLSAPGPALAPAAAPKKRGPLDPPPTPKKFEWDPLARPVIAFIDPPSADDADTTKE